MRWCDVAAYIREPKEKVSGHLCMMNDSTYQSIQRFRPMRSSSSGPCSSCGPFKKKREPSGALSFERHTSPSKISVYLESRGQRSPAPSLYLYVHFFLIKSDVCNQEILQVEFRYE